MKRFAATLLFLAPLAAAQERQPVLTESEQRFEAWRALGDEARWHAYVTTIQPDGEWREAFQGLLADHGEHAFLEWIVLYGGEGWSGPGGHLARVDAREWIRAAVWALEWTDSHDFSNAESALRGAPEKALDWLERHPSARVGSAVALYDELVAAARGRIDASGYAPPLEREVVFADIDPRATYVAFDPAAPVLPGGARWLHQVERALHGYRVLAEHPEPWRGRIGALTRHADPAVQRAAFLTYTHFAPHEVPLELLWRAVGDAKLSPELRAAALAGWSHGHPSIVYVELHGLAGDPSHPLWSAAVTRLADVGDDFTSLWLRRVLDPDTLPPDDAAHLAAELARLDGRAGGTEALAERAPQKLASEARAILERTAWAQVSHHAIAAELGAWSLATLRSWKRFDAVDAALRDAAEGYEPPSEGEAATWLQGATGLVRELAARVLAE